LLSEFAGRRRSNAISRLNRAAFFKRLAWETDASAAPAKWTRERYSAMAAAELIFSSKF
jgi:hypothetical protein